MVDTRGAVCPVLYCLSKGWISERLQGRYSIPFVVHNAGGGLTQNRYYNGKAPAPMCLPSVYLTSLHMTRSPRPSPPYFILEATNTGVGTACEQGY